MKQRGCLEHLIKVARGYDLVVGLALQRHDICDRPDGRGEPRCLAFAPSSSPVPSFGNVSANRGTHYSLFCRLVACELFDNSSLARHQNLARHLHYLFRLIGMSASEWVWDRSLQRSYDVLTRPELNKLSVTEVAHRLGFNSSSHFSTAFSPKVWGSVLPMSGDGDAGQPESLAHHV
ncbi:MAG: helix-turn-helix domain-containing protein [Xanthobacteraceae bacterium]